MSAKRLLNIVFKGFNVNADIFLLDTAKGSQESKIESLVSAINTEFKF